MIKKYIDQNGIELWTVYVNVRGKKLQVRSQRRVNGIKTEAEAKKLEALLLRECERELINKEVKGLSWGRIVDDFELYLRGTKLHKHTQLDYVSAIRRHTPHWWRKVAADITRADARELFNGLSEKGLSVGHQKRIKIIINQIFIFGMERRLIHGVHVSPVDGFQFPKDEEKKPEILTITEIRTLLSHAKSLNNPWYPVWCMALLTGCRNGELFALQFSDIDFENKMISVTKSYNGRTKTIKSTKSGYWRTVPISSELEVLLKELKLQAGNRQYVLPRVARWSACGQALILRKFCQAIGVPSIKFHTLRACFATQLIRQGVPPIQIQKICGWRDLETMQRYVRLAGIETAGVTENLKLLPETEIMGRVVNLFDPKK